jgi:hypothetical protein
MSAQTYAIVDNSGNVVDVTTWDATAQPSWTPPAGTTAHQVNNAAKGGTYISGVYTAPVTTPPVPTAAALANAALINGINLTSTGTPALDATYSCTPVSQANVNAVTTYILLNSTFPGGGTTMPWMDTSGNHHTFPDIATFKAFATAFANFVATVALYGDSNGNIGAIPSANITIA